MDLIDLVAREIARDKDACSGFDFAACPDDGFGKCFCLDEARRVVAALRAVGVLMEWRKCHPHQFDEMSDVCEVLICAPSLVDTDFNPSGIAAASLQSDEIDGPFEVAKWCTSHDHYVSTTVNDATHFMPVPKPPRDADPS